ncbi:MAG TPA: helix-turn-helix domain-containing protein [Candidatus Saccharimonadales bacterium]|nr:helix-turn-helix domain-containing protein [Candidatus Saccharimonadales bacterium]
MSGSTDRQRPTLVIDILSNKWTVHILYALRLGTRRHSEIKKALPDTTQKVLTDTLRKLERCGIVQRTLYPSVPPQVEYKLTELGAELLNLSEIMAIWTEKHAKKILQAQKAYDRRKG